MKEKLKGLLDFQKILEIYIVLQFVIDIITNFCVKYISESLTFGVFARTAFMIVVVLYALIKAEKKDKIKMVSYYGILALYMFMFLFQCYRNFGTTMIISQLKGLLKIFYLPIILVAFLFIWKRKEININNKVFIYALLGYTATIFVGKILGVSNASYPLYNGLGTIGLFYAANEIGVIIAILSPFLIFEILNNKINVLNVISVILLLFVSLEIGTKVPFLNLLILICLAIYSSMVKLIKQKEQIRALSNIIGILVTIIVLVISMAYMPIGANIANSYGISFNKIFHQNDSTVPQEQVNLQTQEEIETAVYSSRNLYLKDNMEKYKESSLVTKLVGIGYLARNTQTGETEELKLVEIDYCDIFLCQGVIGTIVYMLPVLVVAVVFLKNLLKNIKNIFFEQKFMFIEYSILIALLVAFTAGHVLTAPASALLLVISLLTLSKKFENSARGE